MVSLVSQSLHTMHSSLGRSRHGMHGRSNRILSHHNLISRLGLLDHLLGARVQQNIYLSVKTR